jgi:hypothetical protein
MQAPPNTRRKLLAAAPHAAPCARAHKGAGAVARVLQLLQLLQRSCRAACVFSPQISNQRRCLPC